MVGLKLPSPRAVAKNRTISLIGSNSSSFAGDVIDSIYLFSGIFSLVDGRQFVWGDSLDTTDSHSRFTRADLIDRGFVCNIIAHPTHN